MANKDAEESASGIGRRAVVVGGAVGAIGVWTGGKAEAFENDGNWHGGNGFEIRRESLRTLPAYTITFSDAGLRAGFLPYFQRSVNELHSFVNTRVTIGGVGQRTARDNEIYVRDAATGTSCGDVAWGSWDGCTRKQYPSNYVGQVDMQLRRSALNKPSNYVHAFISHEIGHALGLQHIPDRTGQLMRPGVDRTDFNGDNTYKWGDRNGLRHLARDTPAPGPMFIGDDMFLVRDVHDGSIYLLTADGRVPFSHPDHVSLFERMFKDRAEGRMLSQFNAAEIDIITSYVNWAS